MSSSTIGVSDKDVHGVSRCEKLQILSGGQAGYLSYLRQRCSVLREMPDSKVKLRRSIERISIKVALTFYDLRQHERL